MLRVPTTSQHPAQLQKAVLTGWLSPSGQSLTPGIMGVIMLHLPSPA
jgi:hypothetical protein